MNEVVSWYYRFRNYFDAPDSIAPSLAPDERENELVLETVEGTGVARSSDSTVASPPDVLTDVPVPLEPSGEIAPSLRPDPVRSWGTQTESAIKNPKYPILSELGIDLDLSVRKHDTFIMSLIGECFALQSSYNVEKKTTNRYCRPLQTGTTYTISLVKHKSESEEAHNRYQLRRPYIKEFLELMDLSGDGARRVAGYLARNHVDTYLSVGQEYGLGLVGVMGDIEAAAMW
jgi:hypothetical protein